MESSSHDNENGFYMDLLATAPSTSEDSFYTASEGEFVVDNFDYEMPEQLLAPPNSPAELSNVELAENGYDDSSDD